MSNKDLNKIGTRFFHGNHFATELPNGARYTDELLQDYSWSSPKGDVEIVFANIEDAIIRLAEASEVVVGAVAWFTNKTILGALARVQRSAIVVQKEDFLRRDSDCEHYGSWRDRLYEMYARLTPFQTDDMPDAYPGIFEHHPEYNSSVRHWIFNASGEFIHSGCSMRCLGFCDGKERVIPRMHHKFLIFGERHSGMIIIPKAVVTGSFNMTENSTRSRENIVILRQKEIGRAFLREWAQLWCVSEDLNWNSSEPVFETIHMGT